METRKEWSTYVDDGTGLAILETHVLGGGADDAEGGSVVDLEHELVLLVGGLVEHAVEGESGVVDNDVNLSKGPIKFLMIDPIGEGGWVKTGKSD